jgi:DNA repair and recombination protein RAD52
MLSKYLGPEYVSRRVGPGGKQLTYLAGDTAIDLANRIFGHDGWRSETKNEQSDAEREGPMGPWIATAVTRVRVTVSWSGGDERETYHDGTGVGSGKSKSKAEAIELAVKEAETDALKRALRLFGTGLGNCYYDPTFRKYIEALHKEQGLPVSGAATARREWTESDLIHSSEGGAQSEGYGEPGEFVEAEIASGMERDYLEDEDEDVEGTFFDLLELNGLEELGE